MADLKKVIQRFQEVLDHPSSSIDSRSSSDRTLLALHAEAGNWSQAYRAAFETVSLMSLLTPRSLENSDKQDLLLGVVGLASNATAMALNAAKASFDAVQVLELGRGVISGSLNEMRADVLDLRQKYPQLAEEYVLLRDQLDAPTSKQRQVDQSYNASPGLERVIQQIRRLPDLDRFLLASSEMELKITAEYGPVVIINVSEYRCDALLIELHQIRSVVLPYLNIKKIREKTKKGSLDDSEVLEWLWNIIANSILDALGFDQPPSDNVFPHIWWIPIGPLSKFPFHAAGYHGKNSTQTVLDRVMSSYGSSVKVIVYGRSQRILKSTRWASPRALLVAMQDTPKQDKLPSAKNEVEIVRDLCRLMALDPVEPGRHKQDIVSSLPGSKIFHFAGHGYTDESDPSESGLLLEDWETDRFKVINLLEMNLHERSPFLAYLSACGTGEIKDQRFFDENIHLISACQLAGFRHVIGTLWEVNDEVCVDMARITYEGLKDGSMTDKSVCRGLHQATTELRDRWLSASTKTGRGRRSAREGNISSAGNTTGNISVRDRDERNSELMRDADLDEETESANWVPYVHYGV